MAIAPFLVQVLAEFVSREERRDEVHAAFLRRFEPTLDFKRDVLRRSEVHEEVANELREELCNETCNEVKAVLRDLGVASGNSKGHKTYRGIRPRPGA